MGTRPKRGRIGKPCPDPDELRLMVEVGYRLKDIKDFFGAHTKTVYRWCEEHGLPRPAYKPVPVVCMRCRQLKPAEEYKRVNRPDRKECLACVEERQAGRGVDLPPVTGEMRQAFWERVDVGAEDECWNWNRPPHKTGYGQFSFGGRAMRAHRFSYWLHYDEQPGNLCVCHRCDNRLCVNPHHLYLGTIEENLAERNEKGRHSHGEKNHTAKLTEDQVQIIRESRLDPNELARQYGVYPSTIIQIRERRSWKHLD